MDRVIHQTPNFTAALAMSSRRVYKLEAYGADYNGYGWYSGDGMLYIYNGDGIQHNASYTTETNPYHIPGTTVDETPRDPAFHVSYTTYWGYPDNLWAGAATDGKNTMCTYEIGNKYVSSLKGKKSYFLLGDKVVCMGSGISGGTGNVYTTVENYWIEKKGELTGVSELKLSIKKMTASASPGVEYENMEQYDGATDVMGNWFLFDLGEVCEASGVTMKFPSGKKRQEIFRIEVSTDGVTFNTVYDGRSSGTSTLNEYFHAPFKARYIRLVCLQNTVSKWFTFHNFGVIKSGYDEKYIRELMSSITTGFDDVYIDGNLADVEFNKEFVYDSPKYAYIEGAGGYVFTDAQSLSFKRETYEDSVQPFASLWINHGKSPVNKTYSYVLLPKATIEETKRYAENPTVEIISNTPQLHLAKDKETGVWGASVFAVGKCMDIDVKTPCTLVCDTKNNTLYVSDPTHRFNTVKLIMPGSMHVKAQDGVTVNENEVTIDISVRKGDTYSLTYSNRGR